jgi:hypothetical protein
MASSLSGFRDILSFYEVTYVSPTVNFQAAGPERLSLPHFSC